MESEPTHILFDGQKVLISQNLVSVFDFLQKIEKEIESLLNFEKKLNEIKSHYQEMIGLVQTMSDVIQKNNLDFQFTFTKHPEAVGEQLSHYQIIRAEMIVLFANLETLMCLYQAYCNETDDENQIKKLLLDTKNVKKFINQFLLTVDNPYYKANQLQFKHVTSSNVRDLRNSLIHFFSVRGFALTPEILKDKARNLESKLPKATITFITPQEMYKLIQGGAMLMLKKWNSECQNQPDLFERKIKKVKSIVERDGAKMLYGNDVNI